MCTDNYRKAVEELIIENGAIKTVEQTLRILGLSGSLRRDSHNTALLQAAGEMLPHDAEFDFFDIGALPFYNEDVENAALPDSVRAFRERIAAADGLIIATPEYNRTYSGVLKNALEWASRPHGQAAITDKRVLVVGASIGMSGAVNAQRDLRGLLLRLGANVVADEVQVAQARRVFDAEGRLADDTTRLNLHAALAHFVEYATGDYARAA